MKHFNFSLSFLLLGSLILSAGTASAQIISAHTRAELVSETAAVPAEGIWWVGLRLTMEKDWHVYWRNPGDSGLAPHLAWTLPEGYVAGEVMWPYPSRIIAEPLVSFGYEGEVLLAIPVSVPVDGNSTPVSVRLKATWLACKVDCIPGEAELQLELPVVSPGSVPQLSAQAPLFATARLAWPTEVLPQALAQTTASGWRLSFPSDDSLEQAFFFPFREDILQHAALQPLSFHDGRATLEIARVSSLGASLLSLDGVLVLKEPRDSTLRAVEVRAMVSSGPQATEAFDLRWAFVFALIGGIILNFMPCVLPVLSLKLLQLLRREPDRAQAWRHAGAFTLGIMVSFWALAGLLFALKGAGQAVGWGFQFQEPVFVGGMALLLMVFALNLFGLFEIPMPVGEVAGVRSAFGSGVLMTVLATPCTAPFMGSALGFALAQPPLTGLLVFTALGLGLALPLLLFMLFPPLARILPRPGPWMDTLRGILGFVLLACVIWLVGVLGAQSGAGAVTLVLSCLLAAAFVLWLFARGRRGWALAVVVGVIMIGAAMAFRGDTAEIDWKPYTPAAVEEARRSGQAVFLDFTADWCLTCKVNEAVALAHPDVTRAFAERKVLAFKADWTSRDPVISRALASFGREGVPLYVYYPSEGKEPRVLPELLTPALVLDVLAGNNVPSGKK